MSYDQKCYELAEHFRPKNSEKSQIGKWSLNFLAQQIQAFIEDELAAMFICEGCEDEYVKTIGDLCESCAQTVREDSRYADPKESHGRP